jgi:hypothetical protein
VLARASPWLLGADRYGERFWRRLRDEMADAPVVQAAAPAPAVAKAAVPPTADAAAEPMRPRGWLTPRGGWLR